MWRGVYKTHLFRLRKFSVQNWRKTEISPIPGYLPEVLLPAVFPQIKESISENV